MQILDAMWPSLELTSWEASYCNRYFGGDKPGVYRRMYPLRFVHTTLAGEVDHLRDRLATSGRRARVFAITFSGFLAGFNVKFSLMSGEQLTTDFTDLGALLNHHGTWASGFPPEMDPNNSATLLKQTPAMPLIWDPNIVLEGTQELVVETEWNGPGYQDCRFPLNMVFHVWEFPDTLPSRNETAARAARKQAA